MLRAAPEQPANMRVTGLRGVGKTVLLGEFETRALADGWEAVFLEFQPGHNTDESLSHAISDLLRRKREELSRKERLRAAVGKAAKTAGSLKITWGEVSLSLDPTLQEGSDDLARALFDTVEVAVEKGYAGLVLLLDEAQVIRDERDRQGEHPLSLLISVISILQRKEIPLGLVVCGLPTLGGNLLRARSYTERMFRGEEVDSLEASDARLAFAEPLGETALTATSELVDAVVTEVEGYPYFVQLWGAELWDAASITGAEQLSVDLLDAARPDIYHRLDSDFYEQRVATLTPAEQDVLLATADCSYPPILVPDLKAASDKSSQNVNVLLGRLVEQGVLYRVRQGQYDYTAPKFRDYLERRLAKARGQLRLGQ